MFPLVILDSTSDDDKVRHGVEHSYSHTMTFVVLLFDCPANEFSLVVTVAAVHLLPLGELLELLKFSCGGRSLWLDSASLSLFCYITLLGVG